MKIFRRSNANKFLESFVYVAVLSLFINVIGFVSFNALAEDIATNVPVDTSVPESVPVPVEGGDVVDPALPEATPVVDGAVDPATETTPVEGEVVVPEVVPEVAPEIVPEIVEPVPVDEGVLVEGGEVVEVVDPAPVENDDVPAQEIAPVEEEVVVPIEVEPITEGAEPVIVPSSQPDVMMEFLKEKVLDELQKKVEFAEIVPVSIAPQNEVHEVIDVDPNAVHSCGFGSFGVAISEGQAFDVSMYLNGTDSSKISVLKIGELPSLVSAKFSTNNDSILSGALSDSEVLINLSADYGAQKGSFNFPVIFTQVDGGGVSSVNVCQLNLIVQ